MARKPKQESSTGYYHVMQRSEISMRLMVEAKLSLRQAAEILETTHRRVYQALQEND